MILEIRPIQAEEGFRWALKRLEYFFSEKPLTHVYKFNTEKDTWQTVIEIPVDRRSGGAGVTVFNNKIYITNGIVNGHTSGTVVLDNELYFFGGETAKKEANKLMFSFN